MAGNICRHLLSSWLWRRMFAVTRIVALSLSTIAVDETQEETTLQMLQLDTWTQTCGNTGTGKNSLPESYRSVNLPIQAILFSFGIFTRLSWRWPGESFFFCYALEPLELEVQARLCSPLHEHRCLGGLGQCVGPWNPWITEWKETLTEGWTVGEGQPL